ncbi:MAG TPA: AI-2E family transporter [Acidimicrobiaceae bacterium]|nr:AI-2E family transporter [Acidimicrobiaceae bacterium]HCB37576.1 AI-2E family transporter [Acidimicrobiaceae bacterium]
MSTPGARPGEPARPEPGPGDRMPRWVPRAILLLLLGVVALALAYWIAERLRSFFVVILLSLFLSFALEPAVNWLAVHHWRRGLATAFVFVVAGMMALIFTLAMASVLADQIVTLVDEAPGYIDRAADWLDDKFGIEVSTDQLISYFSEGGGASSALGTLAGDIVGFGSTLLGLLIQLFTVLLFTFYLVADGPRLRRLICSLLAPRRQNVVLRGWEIAIDKTGGYIYSRTLLAGAAFLFHWAAFALLGVPFALPLALWVGVISQLVPVVGTYLAGLLPSVVALIDEPLSAVWVIVVVVVYQQIENYLLSPRVTSHTMNIHPALSFGAVIVGAALLGSAGALLAIPATATIQAFVSTYVKRHELVESELLKSHYDLSDDDPDEVPDD